MNSLTLLVALLFCGLVLVLKPRHAMGVYLASLIGYPNYMAVSLGTIDISLSRFVIAVFLLRCLIDSKIVSRRPKWCGLDTVVLIAMAAYTLPFFITHPFEQAFENRAGFLMDSLLPYIVVRWVVVDYPSLIKVIKIAALLLVPLAAIGVLESITGYRLFHIFLDRAGLLSFTAASEVRFGLWRAIGPFSHSILFGCTFGLFLPLIYYLRHESGNWRYYAIILSMIAVVGILSSMSSGPWVLLGIVIICLCMEHAKNWIKIAVVGMIIAMVLVEIISNRPLYHVIADKANPLGGSGWHRAKLIDLAIEHVDEWWLVGYGMEDPGWGEELGMATTDITNEFILAAARYGIWGVAALCAILITSFRYMMRVHRFTASPQIRSLAWAFGSMLTALIVCWMSVSFFGQLIPLFYTMLGLLGAFYVFARRHNYYRTSVKRPVKRKRVKRVRQVEHLAV